MKFQPVVLEKLRLRELGRVNGRMDSRTESRTDGRVQRLMPAIISGIRSNNKVCVTSPYIGMPLLKILKPEIPDD